ncbi:hypothetical protein HNQ60_004451 [Povalibacter uvarum]|uniref:Uncharacterized protein n=1 Tax=Povalibacter uvarum TaxID=732238 RepID=A0A841HQD6_9GAMM|nr:hypothetical protein [Povalibacter uvarum]MBB6095561.1 hypothetical protein [Povalibacter uvarum]
MANPQGPGTGGQRPSKQKQGTFRPEQQGSDEDQTQVATPQPQRADKQAGKRADGADRGGESDRKAADRVEIGDPVPEGDRTIKADRGSARATGRQGETGEDEDLPDADRGVEGTRGGKH